MILAVTPNAAIDRTLLVERLRPGQVHRTLRTDATCGGKGINVARAARDLGAAVRCAGLLGGETGRAIAAQVAAERLGADWTWVAGESRTCLVIVESAGQGATVVNEPGPAITAGDWQRLVEGLRRQAPLARLVCLCGSVPPGTPERGTAALVEAAGGTPTWVDSSGASLVAAASASPAGIKINASEAGELLGSAVGGPREAIEAAGQLRRRGVEAVAITLGAAGAVLVTSAGSWHAEAPEVVAVNPVGVGDAFFAGLLAAMIDGEPPQHCLARATAAGSAAALQPVGPRIDRRDFERLLAGVRVTAR